MNGRIFVSTTSQRRAQEWERIFGTDTLPVLYGRPRLQSVRNRPVLAYDLDLAQLHPGQIARLAAHVARKTHTAYAEALRQMETAVSWAIEATADTYVVETAESHPVILPFWSSGGTSPPGLRKLHLPLPFPA